MGKPFTSPRALSVLAGLTAAIVGFSAGCGNSGSEAAVTCAVPGGAYTYNDASNSGCEPLPAARICPSGCAPECPPHQYQLLCAGPPGTTNTAPVPDLSLNCTNMGGPQASNTAEYCCGCAP